MNLPQKSYDYLEDYLDSLRAKGRYTFSWEEAKQEFSLTDKALNQNLFRLKAKKKIVQMPALLKEIDSRRFHCFPWPH